MEDGENDLGVCYLLAGGWCEAGVQVPGPGEDGGAEDDTAGVT